MIIHVASGIGTGPTKLAAFDNALNAAGVANYNLIHLSSVIPPKTKVVVHEKSIPSTPGSWGDRLYVVIADARSDTPNTEAWAGIGWVQNKKTGKGMFAEHIGASESTVRLNIQQSLEAFMQLRPNDLKDVEMDMKVTGVICQHEPVCALAIAVYKSSGWSLRSRIKS